MPIYVDKVECIFIDPPYSTGNEGWAYEQEADPPDHYVLGAIGLVIIAVSAFLGRFKFGHLIALGGGRGGILCVVLPSAYYFP